MMGLGSAIGAGLFPGSGVGISAGPAVIVSYCLAGIMIIFVMRMFGEMGAALPVSGSFSPCARIGDWAGRRDGLALSVHRPRAVAATPLVPRVH
jgi:aromatic amino acid permease